MMPMDGTTNITVLIAGRPYPLKIKEGDEPIIRRIVKEVNDKITLFQNTYPRKDRQDHLSMALLTYAVDAHKAQATAVSSSSPIIDPHLTDHLSHIDALLTESDEVVSSPQVAGEFVNTMKRKGTPPATLALQIRGLSVFELSSPTLSTISAAWALCTAHSIAWYDAIIVQTAIDARCDRLYSEDLQHGRKFGGLEVVNPFA